MGFLIDFGLAVGANIPSGVFIIGSASQGLIGTNTLGTLSMLADFSSRAQAVSIQRTSDRTTGTLRSYNAGTATVKLLNMDGALDPYVLELAGLTAPGVIMRVRYQVGSTVYPMFYGFVESWNPDVNSPEVGMVTVTATDGFTLLNQKMEALVTPVGAGETVTARVTRVLDALNWPAGARSLGATTSTVQATSFDDTGLGVIQKAVEAEVGEFYIQPDGVAYLRGRHDMATDARSSTVQATYGSNRAGGEIPYVGKPVTAWDKSQMHNRVIAQINGSTNPQIAENATSIGLYGTAYTLEETSLQLPLDSDALSWANYVLASDTKPAFRLSAITLNSALEQIGVATLVEQLTRRMGDRVIVVRRPPAQPYGSVVDSRQVFIQGVNHEWTVESKQLLTTFDLQPVAGTPTFVIGSASQGVIGQNALAW